MSGDRYVNSTEQIVTEIFVRDARRSAEFYQHLGFAVLRDEEIFFELAFEDHRLFLDQRDNLPPPPPSPAANIRVMVPDVDRYRVLADAMGAPIVAEIGDRDYGIRDFLVADPDGFGVRFGTWTKDLTR